MPLSPLTRLRAAIIVFAFAFTLFGLDVPQQAWVGAAALFVLPLLIWLLVSNSVKEAPPFDDKAFHRTRPVTAAQVFRHLAGFHLLVLACLLMVLVAYAWRMNLGWREIALGVVLIGGHWIALVTLFGTVASLGTSTKHWKGWGPVALLLLPTLSLLGLFWVSLRGGMHLALSLPEIPIMAVILYPALWWLVAVKGRWTLGCLLGLLTGIAIPWMSSGIRTPDFLAYLREPPQKAELTIRRLESSATAEAMDESQASVSRLLEIRGLQPHEFIGDIGIRKLRKREEIPTAGPYESDRNLGDMDGTAFSTDANGLLIPATASLLDAMDLENAKSSPFPVWAGSSSEVSGAALADFLSLPLRSRNYPHSSRTKQTFDAAERIWAMNGAVYGWKKVLDTTAKKGGRMKLPGGGIIEMDRLDPSLRVFEITVRCIEGHFQSDPEFLLLHPVLVARGESGLRRFVEPDRQFVDHTPDRGFLVREKEFVFRAPLASSQTDGQIKAVENIRLELYWPDFRGSVFATLHPPK